MANNQTVNLVTRLSGSVQAVRTVIGVATDNYEDLKNKPKINGVELVGDLSSEKLGIVCTGGEGDGLTEEQKQLLVEILRNAVYANDQSANIAALAAELGVIEEDTHEHNYTAAVTTAATCTTAGVRTYTCTCGESYTESIPATGHNYVNGVCSGCGAADPDAEVEVTLTGISAAYNGGDVEVGTAVSDLTGIVVTAHYSDGSSETVTGYTLSGTIAEGSNTITVSYGGKTATFAVTGVEPEVVTYSVTNKLTNVTSNNAAESVGENEAYSATLTAADGYQMDSVAVTMGGVDVTSTAYADSVVSIAAVTGDIVITASASEVAAVAVNLFDKNSMVTEGYFVNTNGSVSEDSGAAYAKISIEGGKTYCMSMKTQMWNQGKAGMRVVVDADGNTLSLISCTGEAQNGDYYYPTALSATNGMTVGKEANNRGMYFVAPENAAEFRTTVRFQTNDCIETLMFEEGDTCHDYVAYGM